MNDDDDDDDDDDNDECLLMLSGFEVLFGSITIGSIQRKRLLCRYVFNNFLTAFRVYSDFFFFSDASFWTSSLLRRSITAISRLLRLQSIQVAFAHVIKQV